MTDKRVTKSKRAIRSAFIRLLDHTPVEQMTITALAKEADVDRKTVYAYYETPADVYREIEDETARELEDYINRQPTIDFPALFAELNHLMEKNRDFYALLSRETAYNNIVQDCMQILADKLALIYHDEWATQFVAAGVVNVYLSWLRGPQEKPLEELSTQLSDFANTVLAKVPARRSVK